MPNTTFGPYVPDTIVQGVTAVNKTLGDHLGTQASVAIHTINNDFSGAFIHSGMVCSRNGVTLNQLDVTAGIGYATMSDGTIAKIATVASTTGQFVTSTPSTTYYLFLKSDGAWQWSTSSVGAGALPICQATTDGSSNISTVTDVRHTAGSPGQPYVVARVVHQHVTATTLQTLATFTTGPHGLYQLSGSFVFVNGSNGTVTFRAGYSDPDTAGAPHALLQAQQGFLNALNFTASAGVNVPCYPVCFYAKGNTAITLEFQDSTGTPGSWVSATLTRLS